jgi:proteic killer suppression protein
MKVHYKERYLEELYDTGQTTDKKHRFQPEVIRRYQQRVQVLHDVAHVKELADRRSLHLEELKGDKKGQWSIRVDDKYRIIFTVSTEGTQPVTTICYILKLSNHYD